ncbi:MAG: AMP nucleosidase [Pseudomonadota bacterium]
MADKPERITILAREFSAAALEFHRGNMAQKGYVMEGSITPRIFQMIEGQEQPKDLFEGDVLFAVTFRLRGENDG